MNKKDAPFSSGARKDRLFRVLAAGNRVSWVWFFVLLALYVGTSILTNRLTRMDGALMISGQPIPYRSLAGAVSSVGNICAILMALFFRKQGFIVSIFLLLAQFPLLILQVNRHNYSVLSGICSNLLIIYAICLIYLTIDRAERNFRMQATTDGLTGLPNRIACTEMINRLVKHWEPFALAVVNLNNFKSINSTMGQSVGDAVLKEVAARWRDAVDGGRSGTDDYVTCQGGNEFAFIIRKYTSREDVLRSLSYYLSVLEEKMTIDGCDYYMTAHVGFAEFPDDTENGDDLQACALTALDRARRLNISDQICRYTSDMDDAEREIEIERKIRTALEDGTLFFCLQPQYDIEHHIRGFEVLARLRDAEGNNVSPADFIPVAEKAGLIDRIDRTVFRDSARFFGDLVRLTKTDITISINVSVRHLMKNDFLKEVREILEMSGVPANQIELEITESVMVDSFERAMKCINEIKSMGMKVAIDDFGTGYSSLSYLSSFPADLLKVDKSFVDQMNTSDTAKQYVAAIISIGHVMNFEVIAEGVEKPDQIDTLRSIGCDYIQGFCWGRPMMPDDARKLVMEAVQSVS